LNEDEEINNENIENNNPPTRNKIIANSGKKKTNSIKPIDDADVSKTINMIVDLMISIDSSRELINTKVKHLKDTYGLSPSTINLLIVSLISLNVLLGILRSTSLGISHRYNEARSNNLSAYSGVPI
jgi:hypothetical protein